MKGFLLTPVVTLLFVDGRASLTFPGEECCYPSFIRSLVLIYKCLFCNRVLTIILFLLTGVGSTLRVDRAGMEQRPAYGKPGLTMASSSLLIPWGDSWVGRRDLQPLHFLFTLSFETGSPA